MEISKIAEELLSLNDRVVIISGGASGIGFGTAKRLSELGAKISILDVNKVNGEKAVQEIKNMGGIVEYIHCDVTKKEDCKNAADKTIELFGKIDVLYNNAGVAVRKNAVDLEPEEWDLALNVSLKRSVSAFKVCHSIYEKEWWRKYY